MVRRIDSVPQWLRCIQHLGAPTIRNYLEEGRWLVEVRLYDFPSSALIARRHSCLSNHSREKLNVCAGELRQRCRRTRPDKVVPNLARRMGQSDARVWIWATAVKCDAIEHVGLATSSHTWIVKSSNLHLVVFLCREFRERFPRNQ